MFRKRCTWYHWFQWYAFLSSNFLISGKQDPILQFLTLQGVSVSAKMKSSNHKMSLSQAFLIIQWPMAQKDNKIFSLWLMKLPWSKSGSHKMLPDRLARTIAESRKGKVKTEDMSFVFRNGTNRICTFYLHEVVRDYSCAACSSVWSEGVGQPCSLAHENAALWICILHEFVTLVRKCTIKMWISAFPGNTPWISEGC